MPAARTYEYRGKRYSIPEIAQMTGCAIKTVEYRIAERQRGQRLFRPVEPRKAKWKPLAQHYNLPVRTVRTRIEKGIPLDKPRGHSRKRIAPELERAILATQGSVRVVAHKLNVSPCTVVRVRQRNEESALKHTCHARGCNAYAPSRMLMCRKHWAKVPQHVQREVCSSFRFEQLNGKRPSREWLTASNAAIGYVAKLEGQKFTPNEARAMIILGVADNYVRQMLKLFEIKKAAP